MCTALTIKSKDDKFFLARTMDFSFELDAAPVFIPRGYEFKSDAGEDCGYTTKYAFVGAGRKLNEYMLADGVNEKGIGIGELYFEVLAQYSETKDDSKQNIAPHEFVTWVLGTIDSLDTLKEQMANVNVMNVKNSFLNLVTPLHWIVADSEGNSIIIEMTASGTHIYENEASVLTNGPEYPWHLTNLNHYSFLNNKPNPLMNFGKHISVTDGIGSGARGLPGDYTSQSRFTRAAFLITNIYEPTNALDAVNTLAHILNSVDIPKGDKSSNDGTIDYTQYKGFMNLSDKEYSMMPYTNTTVSSVTLTDALLNETKPFVFDINNQQETIDLSKQLA